MATKINRAFIGSSAAFPTFVEIRAFHFNTLSEAHTGGELLQMEKKNHTRNQSATDLMTFSIACPHALLTTQFLHTDYDTWNGLWSQLT